MEKEANLFIENIEGMKATVSFELPGKRKATCTWEDAYVPTIPILVNPKAIKAQTRLVMYDDGTVKSVIDKEAAKALKQKEAKAAKEAKDAAESTAKKAKSA